MANLFPFPYADSTKTLNGITYTVNSDESVTITGTATDASQFYVVEASDPIELGPGYYTLQGTGDSDIQIALISVYTPGGPILYISAGEDDADFTLTETKEFHAQIGVPSGTTADLTVAPGLVKTGDLVTIDAENAKQIRRTMDVIIQVTPEQGEPIVINNSNLISCTVSLRSDLSIIEPTLPESEINIEAYFDDDISDVLASIPDETPVTYQAGYPGDMSPVRNFYLAEQITWQDNVMSIHAVDAVHKLDRDIGTALYVNSGRLPQHIAATALGMIKAYAGVRPMTSNDFPPQMSSGTRLIIDDGQTARDLVSQVNQYFHQEDDIWYTYVDAGIPKFTATKPSSIWDIYEDDCGDVQAKTERKIAKITVAHKAMRLVSMPNVGSATMISGVGTSLSFNSPYVASMTIGIASKTREDDIIKSRYSSVSYNSRVIPLIPPDRSGESYFTNIDLPYIDYNYTGERVLAGAQRLLKSDLAQADYVGIDDPNESPEAFTQLIPWDCTYDSSDSFWTDNPGTVDIRSQATAQSVLVSSGIISSGEDAELSIGGQTFEFEDDQIEYTGTGTGINIAIDSLPWFGTVGTVAHGEAYPDGAFSSMLSRSNITGSFTWKGDPRMQPRDVVTFHRLDGTTEDITIENITITHEKGGTSAEITYRKGIC